MLFSKNSLEELGNMAVPNLRQTGEAESESCNVQAKEQAQHHVECLPESFHSAQDLARTME